MSAALMDAPVEAKQEKRYKYRFRLLYGSHLEPTEERIPVPYGREGETRHAERLYKQGDVIETDNDLRMWNSSKKTKDSVVHRPKFQLLNDTEAGSSPVRDEFDNMNKQQLMDFAAEEGLHLEPDLTKDQMIRMIRSSPGVGK